MNDISKHDILFDFKTNINSVFYYGWDSNKHSALIDYLKGYKTAAYTIYSKYEEAIENNNVAILDTLGFPLIFLYRHTIELYLKFLYIELKPILDAKLKKNNNKAEETTKKDITEDPYQKIITSFLNDVGHNLQKIWDKVKPIIIELSNMESTKDKPSRKYLYEFNISAIEHYILEVNKQDLYSFDFRYPFNKSYEMTHTKDKKLDIENLHEKMTCLFDYFNVILTTLTGRDFIRL